MRDYIQKTHLRITPSQLRLLVPAHERAWELVKYVAEARHEERKMLDRLAEEVVRLVVDGKNADVDYVARCAARKVLSQGAAG